MTHDSGRQAGIENTEEIEITPEMIEAGKDELARWVSQEDCRADQRDLVSWVYSAMARYAPSLDISMSGSSTASVSPSSLQSK